MEVTSNFSDLIQLLMSKVKKDIISKNAYQGNLVHNKEIINSLFNLLDYQMTLVNQILLFNKNKNNKDNYNNMIEHLINVNKDILVSMINKFLTNINSIFNKINNNGNNKCNIINKTQNFFKRGKIINLLYSNSNNNSLLISNSFLPSKTSIKKNMESEFNSTMSFMQQSPIKKNESFIENENKKGKISYKFLKNKNIIYNMKNKNNKNIYDKLYYDKDSRCDHEEKKRNKIRLYQSCCKSMKDIFIDLNDDNLKNIFNKSMSIRKSNNSKK